MLNKYSFYPACIQIKLVNITMFEMLNVLEGNIIMLSSLFTYLYQDMWISYEKLCICTEVS